VIDPRAVRERSDGHEAVRNTPPAAGHAAAS
jgi:hypothetical protein